MEKTLNEQDLFESAEKSLRGIMPESATVSIESKLQNRIGSKVDALMTLTLAGVTTYFEVEARPAQNFAANLAKAIDWKKTESTPTVFITNYVQASAREILRKAGQSYIDAAGNIFLYRETPPLLISADGAKSNPWAKKGRPKTNLKGNPAGLVVRTLLDYKTPISIAEVIEKSGASRGAVYRALDFLEQASLIQRPNRGQVESVKWPTLLEIWADNYEILNANRVKKFVSPRGIDALKSQLRELSEQNYAATGSLAAEPYSNYAPTYTAIIYTGDIAELADKLKLQETERGADVLLVEPNGDFQMNDSQVVNGIRIVAPAQAAVDLLNGPGRNPEEGKALIRWMESSDEWRRN